MGRKSRPWFKASHGCHYSRVKGKLVRLAPDYSRSVALLEAIAGPRENRPLERPILDQGPTVPQLVARYLEHAARRLKPTTLTVARWALERFAASVGELPASEVRPATVLDWLDAQGWGRSSRATYGGWVRIAWLWASDRELIPGYRLARLKLGTIERRAPVTEEQARAFRRSITAPDLADWWDLSVGCGARPGEMRTLEARHVSQDRRSGRVTGKTGPREVYFPAALQGRVEALCAAHPSGPILRRWDGEPWGRRGAEERFRRWAAKDRDRPAVVPYHLRGLFASRCHAAGADAETIRVLLGHAPTSVLARHYLTISRDRLLEAVDRGWAWANDPSGHREIA